MRECFESNNSKFNDRGMLKKKLCSTKAGHDRNNDVLHLANDSSVSENDCIIEHGISNSKIHSNRSCDKLVSPVEGETYFRQSISVCSQLPSEIEFLAVG